MHDGYHRTTGGGKPRKIGEAAPAGHEHIRLTHQIGASAFDQLHERKFVFQRQRLRPQRLVDAHGRRRAALDAAVRRGDETAHAGDEADAGNAAAAGNIPVAIIVVHLVAAKGRNLDEGRAAIERERQTLAR